MGFDFGGRNKKSQPGRDKSQNWFFSSSFWGREIDSPLQSSGVERYLDWAVCSSANQVATSLAW